MFAPKCLKQKWHLVAVECLINFPLNGVWKYHSPENYSWIAKPEQAVKCTKSSEFPGNKGVNTGMQHLRRTWNFWQKILNWDRLSAGGTMCTRSQEARLAQPGNLFSISSSTTVLFIFLLPITFLKTLNYCYLDDVLFLSQDKTPGGRSQPFCYFLFCGVHNRWLFKYLIWEKASQSWNMVLVTWFHSYSWQRLPLLGNMLTRSSQ